MKTSKLTKWLAVNLIPVLFTSTTFAASVSKDPVFQRAVHVTNIDDLDLIQHGAVSIRQDKTNNLVYRVDKKRQTLTIFRRTDVVRFFNNNYFTVPTRTANTGDANQPKPLIEIDIYDETKLDKIATHVFNEKGPISVWKGPSGDLVYIVDIEEETLTIYDKRLQPSLSRPIPINLGTGAISVIAKKDDSVAYVSNPMDGTITVIDVEARMVTSKLQVNGQPFCQLLGGDEDRLYVITRRGEKVFVIDPNTKEVIDTLAVKDLDREFQLKQCYQSCHEEKRSIMEASVINKPLIPNHELVVPAATLNKGLRQDKQKLYQNIIYKNHLAKLEEKQLARETGYESKIWRDEVTFSNQPENLFIGKPASPSKSELEQKYLKLNPIVFDLDVGPYKMISDILKPVIMYQKPGAAPKITRQPLSPLRKDAHLDLQM